MATKSKHIVQQVRGNPGMVQNPILAGAAKLFIPELSIIEKAQNDPDFVFNSLAHLLTPELLKVSFELLNKGAAVGIDKVSHADYNINRCTPLAGQYQRTTSKSQKSQLQAKRFETRMDRQR